MNQRLEHKTLQTDVLIIGGGTAGCYAARTLSRHSDLSVIIAERADIRRSGCLAAGVNAINAYITDGTTPMDYVDYAMADANGIARKDLLLTMAEGVNEATNQLEQMGLVILKDESGHYVTRGKRNVKINGENIKPLLAKAVLSEKQVTVLNHINITDLLVEQGQVEGAVGFSLQEESAYVIYADTVLLATGGAAGLYQPNNPGFSRHKMWYPPFNTGAGYAMGLRAGAEMTSFEMRFIALRCKDTIAPTGTIAQGAMAKQVNAKGEIYETNYGLKTSQRLYGTVMENIRGNGPCYLHTKGIDEQTEEQLLKAYLNMAPAQALKWIETEQLPGSADVEIEGTEPYIVGGHTASGFWVDTDRKTTIKGLYAAGDVAGGCPQKYVTGALVEGDIAAIAIIEECKQKQRKEHNQKQAQEILSGYEAFLFQSGGIYSIEALEEAMQKVMDEYAGGIATNYAFCESRLCIAEEKIQQIEKLTQNLCANSMHELMLIFELKERLVVCRAVIAHLKARKETRWHSFNENLDYPKQDAAYDVFVNSVMEDGKMKTFLRKMGKEDRYEHSN